MIAWTVLAAHAADPVDAPVSPMTVRWARPFTLTAPEPWPLTRSGATFSDGWIVELTADPASSIPRQVAEPVPYADATPLWRMNWDRVGGCVVVVVPGPVDWTASRWYFGSDTLPERVDAAHGLAELDNALRKGVTPQAPEVVSAALTAGGAPLVGDLRSVAAAAMERVAGCSATREDLLRSQVPVSP